MAMLPEMRERVNTYLENMNNKIKNPESQRRLVLVIVCIALLLDNMLYMVIVPIIPNYLEKINGMPDNHSTTIVTTTTTTIKPNVTTPHHSHTTKHPFLPPPPVSYNQGGAIGVLFASKAIVQLLVNPFTGALIDRIGYDVPMMIGLMIMFFSTGVFAFGQSYGVMFFARSLQGLGSAFADTSGLAMIADRYTEENERTKALGIALAFISFGSLVAPPFGGVLYEFAGKVVPFIFLAFLALADGLMLLFVMKPVRTQRAMIPKEDRLKGTPIYVLLMDPSILICAGALAMSNVSLAFLEPTIALWMKHTMNASEWETGFVWLPAFFPHIGGVFLTIKLTRKYPQYLWFIAGIGIAIEGIFCLFIPFAEAFGVLIVPICGICFGIALVDTAILPTLGYLVDVKYVSVYGSVYAIADISYSIAYAFGPIVAGSVVQSIGFKWLNVGIFVSNVIYAPILYLLRNLYKYKPFENECDILVDGDVNQKQYMTYTQNGGITAKPEALNMETRNQDEEDVGESEELDYYESRKENVPSFTRLR